MKIVMYLRIRSSARVLVFTIAARQRFAAITSINANISNYFRGREAGLGRLHCQEDCIVALKPNNTPPASTRID